MADNSAALRGGRRQDSRDKRGHAAEALSAMEQTGEAITFPAVARRAGVSVSLLYSDANLASRIVTLTDRDDAADRPRDESEPPVVARQVALEPFVEADAAEEVVDDRQGAEPLAFELEGAVARHVWHRRE